MEMEREGEWVDDVHVNIVCYFYLNLFFNLLKYMDGELY